MLSCRKATAFSVIAGCACTATTPRPPAVDASAAASDGPVYIAESDAEEPELHPARQVYPAASGEACQADVDCVIGVCADAADSPTGRACGYPAEKCPAGYVSFAKVAASGEFKEVCVPPAPKLCNPCDKDDDCKSTGTTGGLCVDHGNNGRFCGVPCPNAGCPYAYACADVVSVSGVKSKQCQPAISSGPFSCKCSVAASAQKLATPCLNASLAGACYGVRVCGVTGLSDCTAKTPTAETCNGQDDDCNGKTDDGATCDDGYPCTIGDACVAGVCKPGTPKICDDGDPCTVGDYCALGKCIAGQPVSCDGGPCQTASCDKFGKCQLVPVAVGSPCDDGDACTLDDTCFGAICNGKAKVCADNNPCTSDTCSGGMCVFEATVAPCDDGNSCTLGDHCDGGVCLSGAISPCDDGNSCTNDNCVPPKGCQLTALADGALCNSGNPCVSGGTCKAGACAMAAAEPCLNAVGCPATGWGSSCANGKGECGNGQCQHTDKQGYAWTLVPAGGFWMGCNAALGKCAANDANMPQHYVELSAFWIGAYEVTVDQYKQCVKNDAGLCTVPKKNLAAPDNFTFYTMGKGQYPVNYLNWSQAQAVCNWLGGNLPSEAQWEKAARGGCEAYGAKGCQTSEPSFPWGEKLPECGNQAVFGNGKPGCASGWPYPVGTGSALGISPYGAYDMAGNVWEWVLDYYDDGFYATAGATAKDAVNVTDKGKRGYRGGGFASVSDTVRADFRAGLDPALASQNSGVRCAKPYP